MNEIQEIMAQVQETGFEGAIAIATDAEVQAGAACGQSCMLLDEVK